VISYGIFHFPQIPRGEEQAINRETAERLGGCGMGWRSFAPFHFIGDRRGLPRAAAKSFSINQLETSKTHRFH
jgi:hypothetical protein